MGTRGLDGVVIDGQIKASYNQYDTYPDGLGVVVLHYARKVAKMDAAELDAERQRWRDVVLVDESDKPTDDQQAALIAQGFSPSNVSSGHDWYAWLRESQGVLTAYRDTGFMLDSKSFGYDSLFCEWAWLVDLDARTFECYVGFQKEPVTGRWAKDRPENGYYGVKLIRTYRLDDLPLTDEGFIAEINALTNPEEEG